MRLIIAIVFGAFTFQCASLQRLGRGGYNTHKGGKISSKLFHRAVSEAKFPSTRDRTRRNAHLYTNIRKIKLWNTGTRYFLQVSKDGRVNGTWDENSKNIWFRIESYDTSIVRLWNIAHKTYVAVNQRGVVISQTTLTDESLFHYYMDDDHDRFSSTKYPNKNGHNLDKWLLTIKKSGKIKNARRTNPRMKSTQFMMIS